MRVVFAIAALLLTGPAVGIAAAADPAPKAAAAISQTNSGVVAETAMALMFARAIGVTAVEKAPTAAIKKISIELATAYTAAAAEWKAAAVAAGLAAQMPSVLDLDHADKAELLLSSFETQFEHEYLDFQIAAHTKTIALLSRPETKALHVAMQPIAARVLAQMTANLDSLRDAKRRLPAM